jgi:hypothetical protein
MLRHLPADGSTRYSISARIGVGGFLLPSLRLRRTTAGEIQWRPTI